MWMGRVLQNPFYGVGLPGILPEDNPSAVARLLALCPAHAPTPLIALPELANALGISRLWLKDERERMGLGSFKALGAAYAIAREASLAVEKEAWSTALTGRVFVTASAGNHGLSVAAGARLFGAKSVIFLARTVPETFARRLKAKGADVEWAGDTYEESMAAAAAAARQNGWTLLSDSSWPGYHELPFRVMEGYLQMASEAAGQLRESPTHIFLQAGVGGMAAAVAAYARKVWGAAPTLIVVEPEAAPALLESIRAGEIVTASGPVSTMGRLDCKTPSMIALAGLARDANLFVTVSEDDAANAVERLRRLGIATTPSGAAGISALMAGTLDLPAEARVLSFISEGPEIG